MTRDRKVYMKEFRKRPDQKIKQAERFKKWYDANKHKRKVKYSDIVLYRQMYPEKNRARQSVYEAIKSGKLTKPNKCIVCNKERYITAHHKDYNNRLDVLWLCASCHKKLHLGIIVL